MTVSTEFCMRSSNSQSDMEMSKSCRQDQRQVSQSESHEPLIVLQHSLPRELEEQSIGPRPHRRTWKGRAKHKSKPLSKVCLSECQWNSRAELLQH
jgi:hypothetical protein